MRDLMFAAVIGFLFGLMAATSGCMATPAPIGPDATGTCLPGPAPVLIGCTEDAAMCEWPDKDEPLYVHCQLPADPSIGRLSYWCAAKCAEVYAK